MPPLARSGRRAQVGPSLVRHGPRGDLIKNRNLRARRGGRVAPAVSAPRGWGIVAG